MIAQRIITILSILAFALSVSSRPYAKTTLPPRQTNTTVVSRQLTGVGNGGQNTGNTGLNSGTIGSDFTLEQATERCGDAQLNCCSQTSNTGDTTNSGIFGAVFGGGDLGIQCNPVNLLAIGIQIPINKVCDAKAACCQSHTSENGLINLGCVALSSIT